MNVWPAIVIVPVRVVLVGIGRRAERHRAVAAAARAARHRQPRVLLLTPVHAHPAGAVTSVDPVPPPAATDLTRRRHACSCTTAPPG